MSQPRTAPGQLAPAGAQAGSAGSAGDASNGQPPARRPPARHDDLTADLKRIGPTLVAGLLAAVYVIVSPPSLDLAAHLLRAKLFSAEGFGLWNNWWYAGHHTPGYSVLFPPVSAALTPQLAAGLAATATAALFEPLARRHFGPDAWLGALWFGAATATNLFTGRLAFAFGLLPAVATALALQRGRAKLACGLGFITALCSPVAALFAALAGAAYAVGSYVETRRGAPRKSPQVWVGALVTVSSLAPVLLLTIAFPEGGTEPFTFMTLWPIPLIGVVMLMTVPRREYTLRAGIFFYIVGCILAYAVPTAVGSNAARLGALVAGPLAALLWWRRRPALLVLAALPLLYIQWQAPIRDVSTAAGDPAGSPGYWRPLLGFLNRQQGPPFRVEIPFTQFHWEAFEIAPRFPSARGWERQLDIKYNGLFYGNPPLTAATYEAWLHKLAIRYVAVADATLDYSAVKERALINSGLPYLHLVMRSRHWRVYEVANATPLAQGTADVTAIGPNSVTLFAQRPGSTLVRVRFTPYWAVAGAPGCVAPDGEFTKLTARRPGQIKLVIRFSLGRIGARTPRCT
jgi:hypothetical protein